jgi:hydrogenase maturation protein HypF
MLEKGVHLTPTSSAGRIFDAAAALLGYVDTVHYEGEGPIKMEGAAIGIARRLSGRRGEDPSPNALMPLAEQNGFFTLDPEPLFLYLADSVLHSRTKSGAGNSLPAIMERDRDSRALHFHRVLASALCRGIEAAAGKTGITTVCLSGGVMQNMLLRALALPRLKEAGLNVYLNRQLSPGDGCIALGQAYYIGP